MPPWDQLAAAYFFIGRDEDDRFSSIYLVRSSPRSQCNTGWACIVGHGGVIASYPYRDSRVLSLGNTPIEAVDLRLHG